ncbi:MAG: polysaccharide biosynthesis protein [Pseudobdellovibrionaceae bacterium]
MQRLSGRTATIILYDMFNILAAFFISKIIILPENQPLNILFIQEHWSFLVTILLVQISCFYILGVYKAIIRFSSIPDLLRILRGVSIAVPLSYLSHLLFNKNGSLPITIFIIDAFLLTIGLSAGRLAYRMMKDRAVEKIKKLSMHSDKKTFIIGAGVAGEKLLREISLNPSIAFSVSGFVDDKPAKIGKSIRGVNILGPIRKLPQLIKDYDIQQLIIAMPSASQEQIRQISQICRGLDKEIELKILPKMSDFLDGKLFYKSLRNVEPEDLLGRKAHDLDIGKMSAMLKSKTILVTGAGGSIGSELCKQIAKFEPEVLILLELTELFLYELEMSLTQNFPHLKCKYIIGDVRNADKLSYILKTHNPQVVFHSAAYKHVPLMELNPFEAIKTNVLGTYNIAKLSAQFGVQRFVLISTDKAINPTNVMGATKRIAELICQHLQKDSPTKYIIVRFGNVLGSSGSVIPLFKKQIEKGGPVTVTHPDMRRYFMSIPEATQLVIQAGSLGNGGEVMLLDMGEPMKIFDLAKEMIELAGLKPNIDINIEFTGLRPGEKLFEELFYDGETMLPTIHPMVKIAKISSSQPQFMQRLQALLSLPEDTPDRIVKESIKSLVSEYSLHLDLVDNAIGS